MKEPKKISVKSLTNKPEEILKTMPSGVTEVFIARIVGSAKSFSVRVTDWGPEAVLKGDFKAIQSLAGMDEKFIREKTASLPAGALLDKIIALLKQDSGEVEFVADMVLERISLKKSAANYRVNMVDFIAPFCPSVEVDPLERLEKEAILMDKQPEESVMADKAEA